MNLNPAKCNLESMGHCLSYNNSCVLHPICCSGGNSVAFVKFFKNHTVFYMAQLLLALIFVILFDTQFFSLQVLSRCHQEFGLLVPNCQLNTMSSVQDVIHYYTTAKRKDTRTFKSIDMDKLPPNLVMGGKVPFKTVSSWQSVIPSKNNKCSDSKYQRGEQVASM